MTDLDSSPQGPRLLRLATNQARPAPDSALSLDIRRLSDGNVVDIPPSGPTLAGRTSPRRPFRAETFVPALARRDRWVIAALSVGWIACLLWFWAWWSQPEHRVSWIGLVVNSLVLLYLSVVPGYFVMAVNRLRRVNPALSVPDLHTAFVVTRAPSEPWSMARATLTAMLAQRFPHPYDVWLCDEDPADEVVAWCEEHAVHLSTRRGVDAYHRATWPRRTKCKEGNLAYFYDRWGYLRYDVVSQLDCDHVPSPTYLAEMVRPFADPAIGYVAAPSVCDANAARSWAARGRLHREATFHGPAQLGHSDGLSPSCIGSHYAVRTAALRDIGGVGPELAEDFSTSFLLSSAGWQGAFAIDAEARGEGPQTFPAMLVQEFQWSRSLTTVLFGLVPRHLGRMPWRLRFRFMFALLFYVSLTVTTVGGLSLPPIAAVTGLPWINVNYVAFLLHWWSISMWVVLMAVLLKRRGLLRPRNAPIISWENWLYSLSRWPLVAWGVCAATLQTVRPRPLTFKVTPKSVDGLEPLPTRIVLPYAFIAVVLSSAALVGEMSTSAVGYIFLCLLGATTYLVVTGAVSMLHAAEAARHSGAGLARAIRATVPGPLLVTALTAAPVVTALTRFPTYAVAVFSGAPA
ncbi:glycosyltransferase [Actinomycetospora endophytica]|uniref:Glycosyltransferase n=1 Tax=Actinomycetospora endophytica TaxID=2291215 RepID=A0ABS8PFJ8_9PSEU|nr:glycosyltransferase [Actinomycetospora endophytica]MCD2196196.1 glycosyltransferase [Actinomycetospora endophytica]